MGPSWLARCLAKVWSRCLRCGTAQELQLDALGVYAECPSCQYWEAIMNWRAD